LTVCDDRVDLDVKRDDLREEPFKSNLQGLETGGE